MKRLSVAMVLAFLILLAAPAHPASKSVTGCIKQVRLTSDNRSNVSVGDKTLAFGKTKLHILPFKVAEPYASTQEEWAKWEKWWEVFMAAVQTKVQATVFYEDTTNVVGTIDVLFDRPCQ